MALIDTLRARPTGDDPLVVASDGRMDVGTARALGADDGLDGAAVALSIDAPLALVQALIALDGRAGRLLLIAPSLPPDAVHRLCREAGTDVLVSDRDDLDGARHPGHVLRRATDKPAPVATRWIMTTSGTTGIPKMVAHDLSTLARTVRPARDDAARPAWGLLYEPTRFAGLQVVLQALLGHGRLIVPDRTSPMGRQLAYLAAQGCSHLSATPTLWRKILMSPEAEHLAVTQITMGGEIADAAVLRAVAGAFRDARVTHIYASTEVGVGFSVKDGRPGFPRAFLDQPPAGADIKVVDGELWLRPPGRPTDYVARDGLERDAEGFVRSGDFVRVDGDRVLFLGRDSSCVNIGGVKIHPEEVEHILHGHPTIAVARIGVRKNPIVGALLTLTVVPRDPSADADAFKKSVLAFCRERLPREAVPATVRVLPDMDISGAGKLSRIAE